MKLLVQYSALMFFFVTIGLYSQTDDISLSLDESLIQDKLSELEIEEWKRLKYFQTQLEVSEVSQVQKEIDLKNYAKDSLRILKIKLLAVKILKSKNLLEQDISENTGYYQALLQELKESDLQRSEYLFLENRLAFLTTEVAENKYAASKIIITVLILLVVPLLYFTFRLRNKSKGNQVQLSPQEKNVHRLILGGKTNKEIADELFISLSTVKTHITNIYGKLKISSRQELLQRMQN